jgi:hypothetical protein
MYSGYRLHLISRLLLLSSAAIIVSYAIGGGIVYDVCSSCETWIGTLIFFWFLGCPWKQQMCIPVSCNTVCISGFNFKLSWIDCAGHYLVGWINAGSCIHSPGIQSGNLPLCLPLSESLTYVVKAEHKITLLPSSTVCLHASFFFRAKYVLGCLFKITLTCWVLQWLITLTIPLFLLS